MTEVKYFLNIGQLLRSMTIGKITVCLKRCSHGQIHKHSGSIPRNACVACGTAMRDYQESVTTRQTDVQTDRQTLDKMIPMCHNNASQATQ